MSQIIQKKRLSVEHNWQKELAKAFTDPESLLNYLNIDVEAYGNNGSARALFPMRVPRPFADLMEKGNLNDPLLQQVLPLSKEYTSPDNFTTDPLAEHDNANQGLLHKYQSRVLLIVKGGCAVNCRYCFRRHFPYQDNALNKQSLSQQIDYIANNPQINEVILSGGDPLMAKTDHLQWISQQLEAIEHVTRLRIHTRLPVVLPQRIDDEFITWLANTALQKVMVLHINHSNEVSELLAQRVSDLQKRAGVTLLNQAVLLAGINDSADSQEALHNRTFSAGILPYYLHLLDKVKGASHFDVSEQKARQIMEQLIKRLPGFLVPKLVAEIGGQPGKTPIDLRLHPQG